MAFKDYLHYDPTTGIFTWIKKPSKKIAIGSRAGSINKKDGYRAIYFQGKNYAEHRLAWYFYYGKFPDTKNHIDHINHNKEDNRIDNLREVTPAENSKNRPRFVSRLDEAGIWWCKRRKRYISEITLNQKKVYQKIFVDINEAITQRRAKLKQLGFHDNHGEKKV